MNFLALIQVLELALNFYESMPKSFNIFEPASTWLIGTSCLWAYTELVLYL